MNIIRYETYDDYDLSKGLCVYIAADFIDNQKLLEEILRSEWKYVVDMSIYFNENDYDLIDYARKYFTDDQYDTLREYMIKGIGVIIDHLI